MAYPTLYEYYTSPKISAGLSADQPHFTLNNKNITFYSGAMHYFRVPPEYWRDRLRKLRAAGLNCVETYIPWNLHEPQKGCFDFGKGGSDFQQFLDVEKFLQIAVEEDLFAIVRPGPYICAEWEFGGLPSWLLREENIKIRTSDEKFVCLVKSYFKELLKILTRLQFTKGGPIVAFQIENEYGNTKVEGVTIDSTYLSILKDILTENNITELLFTSDTPSNGFWGTLPNVLATANFQTDAKTELGLLKKYQSNKPLMVMEYWTGWFDHWIEKHHTRSTEEFAKVLEDILAFGASFNMYMFHGGTNWGLLNGANIKNTSADNSEYQPDTTSYDYDAPLTESGSYTDKYYKVKELVGKFSQVETRIPEMPTIIPPVAYKTVKVTSKIRLSSLLKSPSLSNSKLVPMELLPINNNNGQSYGYVVYRTRITIPPNATLKIEGHVCDTVLLLVNGVLKSKILENHNDLNSFGFWRQKNSSVSLANKEQVPNAVIDLVVENYGRVNYGKLNQFNQFKGLWQGNVLLNDKVVQNWDIFPLEFKRNMLDSLDNWEEIDGETGPAFYKATLNIDSEVRDTYIFLKDWVKGMIVVNGFILARYFKLGPQLTAYVPAPFLRKGQNTILIFEHFVAGKIVEFVNKPVYSE